MAQTSTTTVEGGAEVNQETLEVVAQHPNFCGQDNVGMFEIRAYLCGETELPDHFGSHTIEEWRDNHTDHRRMVVTDGPLTLEVHVEETFSAESWTVEDFTPRTGQEHNAVVEAELDRLSKDGTKQADTCDTRTVEAEILEIDVEVEELLEE